VNAVDLAIRVTSDARGAAAGLDSTTKKASRMGKVGAAAGKVLAVGLGAAAVGAFKLAQGAAKDEASASRLAKQLENTAGATKKQVAACEDWITAQGKALGVADDELRPALAKLTAATHDVGEAQKLTALAMDISAGSGKSLESVTAKLVKIQNGSGAAAAALGVKTKETSKNTMALHAAQVGAQTAQLKYNESVKKYGKTSAEANLAASKLKLAHEKVADATTKTKSTTIDADDAMKRLAKTYGGAAAKAANTNVGKTRRMKLQFSEMGETIGYKLIPVMLKASEIGLAMADWLEKNQKTAAIAAAAIVALVATLWAVSAVMKVAATVSAAYNAVQAITAANTKRAAAGQWALNAALLANPVVLVVVAVAALAAALVIAYKRSETFRAIVDAAFRGVQRAAGAAIAFVRDHWKALFVILTGPVGLAVLTIIKHRDRIMAAIGAVVGWVRDHWRVLFVILTGPVGLAVLTIIKHRDKIIDVLGAAISWVREHWNTIESILTSPFHAAATAAQKVVDTVQKIITKIKSIPTPHVDLNPFNKVATKGSYYSGGQQTAAATGGGGDVYYVDMSGLLDSDDAIDKLIKYAKRKNRRNKTGQVVLFG
jgi:hypothetical protein